MLYHSCLIFDTFVITATHSFNTNLIIQLQMKKQLLMILAMGAISSAFAQLPVSTTPQNRKVVLEEYTGIHCGYCPDGHKIAQNIYNADPNNVILVNVHAGGFATPSTGEPDFRSTDGTSMNSTFGISSYPSGQVNRNYFVGTSSNPTPTTTATGTVTLNRGSWTGAANNIKTQSAYCNVAVQGTVDATTRVLTVQAQVYYTASSPVATNYLTIMLLENNVPGPQSDYGNYNPTNWNVDGTYKHNHFLRKTLTPTFGTPISTTSAGSTFSTTVTYTVPAVFGTGTFTNTCMLGRLELVAFVNQANTGNGQRIINGARGPLALTNIPNTLDAAPVNLLSDAEVCAGNLQNIKFKFNNNGSATITNAVFSYNINGGTPNTFTFTGSVGPLSQSSPVSLPNMVFTPLASNTLNISVVSVNAGTDQNSANDATMKLIPLTAVTANSVTMQMDFTQDRYGSEVGWGVYDEATMVAVPGATIAYGTYPDLTANGTQLHTHTFVVSPAKCYKLVVNDQYGDGVNAGYGVGGYALKSGISNIIVGNGQYGAGENKWYKTSVTAGIATAGINVSNVTVYPNPAVNSANLSVEMTQNENVNVVIMNSLGQVVYNESLSLEAGSNNIKLNTENWAGGLYNINMSTSKGSATQKLTISK
jgi:hypothetical protein